MNLRHRVVRSGFVVIAGIALFTCDAPRQGRAQNVPSTRLADSVSAMMQNMSPAFGLMMQSMMEATLTVLERPETAERLASFTRNYYEALIRKGFTESQALALTAAVGFPSVMSGR